MSTSSQIDAYQQSLSRYPTQVTINAAVIDVRTPDQLQSLNDQVTSADLIADKGDAAVDAGYCPQAASLSAQIQSAADQFPALFNAFAAQDTERLKGLSLISAQKYNQAAQPRLDAETTFSSNVKNLLSGLASEVAALPTSAPSSSQQTGTTSTQMVETEKSDNNSDDEIPVPPQADPLKDVIPRLPGFVQATIPDEVTDYDEATLKKACDEAAEKAAKLGATSDEAVVNYVVLSFLFDGQLFTDTESYPWVDEILDDQSLGNMNERIAVLSNAAMNDLLRSRAVS